MKIPATDRHILSKSTFMMGRQCPKRLWLYKNRSALLPELSVGQEMIFEKGTDVGKLARLLFPGGKDASPIDSFNYPQSIKQTYDWIQAGEHIVYEAAFQYDRVMAALDILVKKKGKWYGYEVKSSTKLKDQHLADAALQYFLISNTGLHIENIFIIYINSEYVRKGELNLKQLFNVVSIKKEVIALQKDIPKQIEEYKAVLKLSKEPTIDIGPHCSDPYECEFMDHCRSHIPEVSIFNLTRLKADKKFELYYNGIIEFHQLPDEFSLTAAQELQIKAYLESYTHIDTKMIKEWLKHLKYPLYFMDFETFMPAVPLYDNSSSYWKLCCPLTTLLLLGELSNALITNFHSGQCKS